MSDYLTQADVHDVCFVPGDHLYWTDDARRVAFAGWQAVTSVGEVGSYWHTDEQGLTAFSGRIWPRGAMWRHGESWAEQLARHWRHHSIVDGGQPLGGIHAAVAITRAGTGTIVTDPLSIAMIYRAESDDVVAFSTSARLAAHVVGAAGGPPRRDALAVAWLPLLGWMVGDRTGFESTRVVPMGSYVEIGPNFGSRLRFSNPTPWASDLPSNEAELVELVHQDLTESVLSVSRMPAPRRVADLTGGKDSRLVLSLMLQEGVTDNFAFDTKGFENSPDAVVAHQIAARYGLEHSAPAPQAVRDQEFSRRLATHAFQTSGASNAWEAKGNLGVSAALTVTGCVGEALRTHFHSYPPMSTREEFRQLFHRRSALHVDPIVRRDVRAELLDRLDAELVRQMDAGGTSPQDHADSFYWRHRNRRWFGTYEEIGEAGRVHPLYSLLGFQAAFALGGQARRREALHFAIMNRACPELAKVPFAGDGWSEDLVAHLPDADAYRVDPVRPEGQGLGHNPWKPQRLLDNLDVARTILFDESTKSVYDILDRTAVERALAEPERASPHTCRKVFGALTAAVWLGGHEAAQRIGDRPRPVRFHTTPPVPTPAPAPARRKRPPRRGQRVLRVARRGWHRVTDRVAPRVDR